MASKPFDPPCRDFSKTCGSCDKYRDCIDYFTFELDGLRINLQVNEDFWRINAFLDWVIKFMIKQNNLIKQYENMTFWQRFKFLLKRKI